MLIQIDAPPSASASAFSFICTRSRPRFFRSSLLRFSLAPAGARLVVSASASASASKGANTPPPPLKPSGSFSHEELQEERRRLPAAPQLSLARLHYSVACEDAVNLLINVEYNLSYVYHSMFAYFDRDNVALKGFARFFKEWSEEERDHAEKLMEYQNNRGGKVALESMIQPLSEYDHERTDQQGEGKLISPFLQYDPEQKGDALYVEKGELRSQICNINIINKKMALITSAEYNLSYVYHSMFAYFDRDNVALQGLAKFFDESGDARMNVTKSLMQYQNKRGGIVTLEGITKPVSSSQYYEDELTESSVKSHLRILSTLTSKSNAQLYMDAVNNNEMWKIKAHDRNIFELQKEASRDKFCVQGAAISAMELAFNLEKLTNEKMLYVHKVGEENNDVHLTQFLEAELLGKQVEVIKRTAEYVSQLRRVDNGHGVWHFDQRLLRDDIDT